MVDDRLQQPALLTLQIQHFTTAANLASMTWFGHAVDKGHKFETEMTLI